MQRRRWTGSLFLILALVLVACAGGNGEETGDETTELDDAASTGDEDGGEDGDDAAEDAPEPEAVSGGDVVIALGSEPTTLDPQVRNDGGERAVNHNIYEALMGRDAAGELIPELATDEPTQIDDVTWEFSLQEGVEFHNGEPFNAEAVVHSIERVFDEELASEQVAFLGTIERAEAVDEHTVRIITDGPDPVLPARMYWLRMVPPEHSASAGFADEPVGTGPYTFVEWQKGDNIKIEVDPDYWGGAPTGVERAEFRFAEASGTRLAGLLSGEFDVIANLQPEDVDQAPAFAAVDGLDHPLLILDIEDGITSDVRVRQALNYAVDRNEMAEFLLEGYAVPASHPFSAASFGYNPDLDPYPYDPELAEQLLEEAGAAGGTVELVSTSGRWLKDREITETVASYWEDVGLTVDVRIFEFSEYLNRLFDIETRPDAVFVAHSNELLDADLTLSSYYDREGRGNSNDDAEMTERVRAARSETDQELRETLYHDILAETYEDAWHVHLLTNQDIWGLSERVVWTPRLDFKVLLKDMQVTS